MRLYFLTKTLSQTAKTKKSMSLLDHFFFLSLLLFSSITYSALPSYQVFIIPTDEPAEAVAINDAGQVAGFIENESGQLAFIYAPEDGLHFLGTLGGETSIPSAINESGQIVGMSNQVDNVTHAFLWDFNSGMNDLTPLHASNSKATDISNTGIVVGNVNPAQAFEWSSETGLQIVTDEREGFEIEFLGIADNGTKLKKLIGPSVSDGISYYLSSIPDQNDWLLGRLAAGSGNIKVNAVNHNAVAAGWNHFRSGARRTFYADASLRMITEAYDSSQPFGTSAIIPVDINDKKWIVSFNQLFIPDSDTPIQIHSELIADSSDYLDEVATLRVNALNNHGDIVGHITLSDGRKVAALLINENREIPSFTRIAQYSADFDNPQTPGWSYLWNADVQIGQSDGYVNMLWDRWKYDSDGIPGLPDRSGLAYGYLSAFGGHPGRGTLQGEASDRYVIAGFTVDQTGEYRISNSHIDHTGCNYRNGGLMKVYIDDSFIASHQFNSDTDTRFDTNLGMVDAGSTIYVAIGPDGKDACDGFDLDYAIDLINLS